jgi:hypothetical protein
MRRNHEEMLPQRAFNSRGSVIGGRAMQLHGGSDMGNWSPFIGPRGGSTIGGESEAGNQLAPSIPVAGIGPESGSYEAPAVNPWATPGTGGWPGEAPAPAPAPAAPVAPTPVAAPVAGGVAGGGVAGGGGGVAVNPAYRGVTLNTDATKSSVWNPAQTYYATNNPVQSQYSWAPRSEATPLQGGIPNWGIQQQQQSFDVNRFIQEMLAPSQQSQTNMLPTPYPGR